MSERAPPVLKQKHVTDQEDFECLLEVVVHVVVKLHEVLHHRIDVVALHHELDHEG